MPVHGCMRSHPHIMVMYVVQHVRDHVVCRPSKHSTTTLPTLHCWAQHWQTFCEELRMKWPIARCPCCHPRPSATCGRTLVVPWLRCTPCSNRCCCRRHQSVIRLTVGSPRYVEPMNVGHCCVMVNNRSTLCRTTGQHLFSGGGCMVFSKHLVNTCMITRRPWVFTAPVQLSWLPSCYVEPALHCTSPLQRPAWWRSWYCLRSTTRPTALHTVLPCRACRYT